MSGAEIQALMALLDDPDEGVYSHVRSRLLEQGDVILPILQAERQDVTRCETSVERLDELMSGMLERQALAGLRNWSASRPCAVMEGAFWIESVCGFGQMKEEGQIAFAALRRDVWLELNEELTALEQIRVINHVMFTEYGFQRASLSEQGAAHAAPAQVLMGRKGSPLGLGMIYMGLADSLGISLHPVSVSGLFFLAYVDPHWDASSEEVPRVWFYVNPFDGGQVVAPEELSMIAQELETQWKPTLLDPHQVCFRLAEHLSRLCEESGHLAVAQRLTRLMEVLR